MRIRPANLADVERCQALDASYTTSYVWQMEEQREAARVAASFQRMRLPRPARVRYPRDFESLLGDLRRHECFLVADDQFEIVAYLDMTVCRWRWWAEIQHLVVAPAYRRRGIASHLLNASIQWAQGSTLRGVDIALQSKNDPAIELLTTCGFEFNGYADCYYGSELALFYALRL